MPVPRLTPGRPHPRRRPGGRAPAFRRSLILLAAAFAALACASPALASHEKGGFLSTSITADGHLRGTLVYLQAGSCTVGVDFMPMQVMVTAPDASQNPATVNMKFSQCVPNLAGARGTFDVDLATFGGQQAGVYRTSFSSCCRIGGIKNVTDSSTAFESTVRSILGKATGSPQIDSNVATGIGVGYEYRQNLNASDPDGGKLTYNSRAGLPGGPSTDLVTFQPNGDVVIPASTTATLNNNDNYVYKVRVTDAQGDFSERDVLLTATTTNHPPAIGGLPAAGEEVLVEPGTTRTITVTGTDSDSADVVTLSTTTLPSYVTFTQTPGNPATGTLTIAPPAGMAATTVGVNLDAVDNNGAPLTASGNLQIRIATRPQTTIDAAPAGSVTTTTPAFSFSADLPGSTFECRLDGGTWDTCTSPYTPAALADGAHTFDVRAVNGGLTDTTPATAAFVVDTVAPATPTVDQRPADVAQSATIHFSGEGAQECRLDLGEWAPCTSPFSPAGLADGEHLVEVRSYDEAGNRSPSVSVAYRQDTTPPAAPAIVEAPAATTTASAGTVKFAGEPGGSFECRLDGGAWAPCADAVSYSGLAAGRHVVEIRQIDSAGNVGQPASAVFTVAAAIKPQPAAKAATTTVATRATVQRHGVQVGCGVDHGSLRSCTVRVYARVADARGASHRVLIGTGAVTVAKPGTAQRKAIAVKLNQRGRALLARTAGGLRVTVESTVRAHGVAKALRGRASSRLLPQRQLVVPADGLFAVDSARLLPAGARYVRAIAPRLAHAKRITCVGHTDASGNGGYNQALGLARARTVCQALVAGAKLRGVAIVVRSAGESHPRATNGTAAGRALNRRVALQVDYR